MGNLRGLRIPGSSLAHGTGQASLDGALVGAIISLKTPRDLWGGGLPAEIVMGGLYLEGPESR